MDEENCDSTNSSVKFEGKLYVTLVDITTLQIDGHIINLHMVNCECSVPLQLHAHVAATYIRTYIPAMNHYWCCGLLHFRFDLLQYELDHG